MKLLLTSITQMVRFGDCVVNAQNLGTALSVPPFAFIVLCNAALLETLVLRTFYNNYTCLSD